MRAVLAQLELVSAVPAANPNPSTPGTDESKGGRRPPGDLGYTVYARWYGPPFHERTGQHPGCTTDQQRDECIAAARRELAHLRKAQPVDRSKIETVEQAQKRMLKETEGCTLQQVAESHWRMPPSVVRRLRVADGRDAETGLPVVEAGEPQDLASRARAMKHRGMSIRQIAMALGTHNFQVQRMLRKAA